MPIFAALVSSLMGSFASFFAFLWAKKLAVSTLAIAGFALSLTALMLVFNTAVSPLIQAMFSTQYGQFLGLAFPPIAGSCMASIAACWAGCALYKLKIQSIKMSASS